MGRKVTTNSSSDHAYSHIGNLLLPVIILAVAIVNLIESLDFPKGEDVGPAVVPLLWIAFTVVFCVSLIVQAFLRRGTPDPVPGKVGFVLLFVGWLAVYLVSITAFGYFVSTLIFLIGSMYMLTYRNHLLIFAVVISWLSFCYIVFMKILFIPLPIGPLLKPFLE